MAESNKYAIGTRSPCITVSMDMYVRLNVATCVCAMYTQTNVGLLCCVCSDSDVAVLLGGST